MLPNRILSSIVYAADIPHLGILFERVRKSRGVSQTEIASALSTAPSTIHHLEQTGRSRRHQIIERYLDALQGTEIAGRVLNNPLNVEQANTLRQLHQSSNGHLDLVVEQVSALDLRDICSANPPAALNQLLNRLRSSPRPAFIADGLWFIHAINGAAFNLFSIPPSAAFNSLWEGWHIMGAKFAPNSPVRAAYHNPDIYFPPTVDFFFRSTATYLFTPQMRALLHRLHQLSAQSGLRFSEWWYSATSFNLHYNLDELTRIIHYEGKRLQVASSVPEVHSVQINPDYTLPYLYGEWIPLDETTQHLFNALPGRAHPHEVYFAADADVEQSFHVNNWPEVHGLS